MGNQQIGIYFKQFVPISDCLKKIKYDLCARCSYLDLKYLRDSGLTTTPSNRDKIHNYSGTNNLLVPTKAFDPILIEKYFDDIEHGFFHGLCGCIISFILDSTIKPSTWVSIILHDFLKANGVGQDDHDAKLIDYFDNLLPITYKHGKIHSKRTRHTLIKADRIELRRYSDYSQWVDDRYNHLLSNMPKHTQDTIDQFYAMLRPSLLYFYQHRSSIFIRHGYEKYRPSDTKTSTFPPPSSYWKRYQAYAIEVDQAPFSNQLSMRDLALWQDNHCSNHGGNLMWNRIKGFIPIESYRCLGGFICTVDNRDHLMAKSDIAMPEWSFVLSNTIPADEPIIATLLDKRVRIVDQPILYDMFSIYKLLYNRLMVLNHSIPTLYG